MNEYELGNYQKNAFIIPKMLIKHFKLIYFYIDFSGNCGEHGNCNENGEI